MRSQVQVLAGPPPIPAGHSAATSQPRTLAASLGRAGAAPPIPAGTPSGWPPCRAAAHDHHPPWSPTQPEDASHAAGAASSRRDLLPCPHRRRQPRALRTPAWPGRAADTCGRRPPTTPGPGSAMGTPADRRATSAASPAPGLLSRRPSRPTVRPPQAASTGCGGDGCPAASTWPQRHRRRWEEMDATGRMGVDSRGLDTGRVDSRGLDAGRVDSSRVDRRTPGRRTR
jgi:hypothetical protein